MKLDIREACTVQPKPLDFVLPGLLPQSVGALISPGGAGKSMLTLQLACDIAAGSNLTGFVPDHEPARVSYIALEDAPEIIARRLFRLHQRQGLNLDRLAENLRIWCGERTDVLSVRARDKLLKACAESRLVIIDTLRRAHKKDENSGQDMVLLVSALEEIGRETGAAVLFLHHSSKSSAVEGRVDQQQASRGSSVLVDNIRWQAFLSGMTEREAKRLGLHPSARHQYVRFGLSKHNYCLRPDDIWFQRSDEGVLVQVDLSNLPAGKQDREQAEPKPRPANDDACRVVSSKITLPAALLGAGPTDGLPGDIESVEVGDVPF